MLKALIRTECIEFGKKKKTKGKKVDARALETNLKDITKKVQMTRMTSNYKNNMQHVRKA